MFFGTPEWALPSLQALLASGVEVAAVVTNPDRPAGRGMQLRPSPVKAAAVGAGIDVLQPAKARDPELHAALRSISPDVATVVAYGKILPAELLALPPLGFVNLHFSLLPEYRGAAPVQHALIDGRSETGVSIMVLTEGMDEGPVLATRRMSIEEDDTAGTLGMRLARAGADLLAPSLIAYAAGGLEAVPQDHDRATYAPKISPDRARIDWSRPTHEVRNFVRGLNPSPGAWTTFNDVRWKIHAVHPSATTGLTAGEVTLGDSVVVGTGDGAVELSEVQPAGKRTMTGVELARGLRLAVGQRLR